MNDGTPSGPPKKRNAAIVAVAAVAAIAGFAAVYGTLGRPDNTAVSSPEAAAPAPETRKRAPGLPAFVFKAAPETVAEVTFADAGGGAKTLKDFHGKTILLNLWATWCAPCRHEMPSLDRLQAAMPEIAVVPVATGRNSVTGIEKFFAEAEIKLLPILRDPKSELARGMGVMGLPVTVILNPEGQEVARLIGDAEWDSVSAKAIMAALVAGQ
jgi:thiol-disulfide isomerase/thioredoxin